MTFPALSSVEEIQRRLELIFPEGVDHRNYLTREMAAKTIFVMLYGGMIEGSGRQLRPSHVYRFSDEQSQLHRVAERESWVVASNTPRFASAGAAWYHDT